MFYFVHLYAVSVAGDNSYHPLSQLLLHTSSCLCIQSYVVPPCSLIVVLTGSFNDMLNSTRM